MTSFRLSSSMLFLCVLALAISSEALAQAEIKIYVGNLPFSASDDEVRELFSEFGEVKSVNLVTDRDTGRPRGFGFVTMERQGGLEAIEALNNSSMGGRALRVTEARPR